MGPTNFVLFFFFVFLKFNNNKKEICAWVRANLAKETHLTFTCH